MPVDMTSDLYECLKISHCLHLSTLVSHCDNICQDTKAVTSHSKNIVSIETNMAQASRDRVHISLQHQYFSPSR